MTCIKTYTSAENTHSHARQRIELLICTGNALARAADEAARRLNEPGDSSLVVALGSWEAAAAGSAA